MNSTKIRARSIAALLFAAVTLLCSAAAQNTRYKLIDLGTFGGPNSPFSSSPVVKSVNNRGTVAGGADTDLPDPYAPNCFAPDCHIRHAFKWENGFLTDLGTLPPGGFSSTAYWINDRGIVLGDSENGLIDSISGQADQLAVVWERDGEIVNLGTLGGGFSFGNAMNTHGDVVGISENTVPDPFSYLFGTETHAFVWRDGFMVDLGTLGGPDSFGSDINEEGNVVGWSYINSTPNSNNGDLCVSNVPTQDPVLWRKDGSITDLGTLGGTCGVVGSLSDSGSGGAINNRGQIIGTSNLAGNQAHHAFLWNEGALIDLGTLGGDNSEAYWINNVGEIVGRADGPGLQRNHHAFLWKHGRMRDLGTAKGWPCSTAIDINSKGQVIINTGICGAGGGPGLLWENGALYDLNTLIPPNSGFVIGDVNYINDRGDIAATGVLPNGDQHALLLVPVDQGDDIAKDQAPETKVVPVPMDQPNRPIAPSSARKTSRYGRLGPPASPLP